MAPKNQDPQQGDSTQTPPPEINPNSPGAETLPTDQEKGGKKFIEFDAAQAIYNQLVLTRKTLDELVSKAREAKLQRQLEQLPVNTSDLMRGFQSAVARANRAVMAGDGSEDIGQMLIKNLEIAIEAPLIHEAHAEDPMIMLPNENGDGNGLARVSMKFNVVSTPKLQ